MTISAEYGLISQDDYFKKIVASSNLETYYLIEKGEFAYNRSYSKNYKYGTIKRLDLYDKGVVSPIYICFKSDKNICSNYLMHYFESNKWNKYAASVCTEGARNHGLLNIQTQDFFNMPIPQPALSEQEKIGNFFIKLDSLINLQENKIILLNKYKKGLLLSVFTSFSKDKIISLKELIDKNIIEIKRGNIIPKQNGIYPVYSSSIHNNGLFCYSDNYMFDEELVSWSIDGGGNFFYRPKHKFSLTNVTGYIKVKNKNILNTQYLYYNLDYLSHSYNFDYQNKALPSYISKLYKIYLPPIKVQEKTAKILSTFDELIEKENNILSLLKQYKQGLLQQMFI